MRLLVDTNIFLEVLLAQSKADDAKRLLSSIDLHEIYLSDYSLHSIGTILLHQKKSVVFQCFIDDMLIQAGITALSLSIEDMPSIISTSKKFHLDFDDAYQLVVPKFRTSNSLSVIASPKGVAISRWYPGDCFTSFAMTHSGIFNENECFQKGVRN